MVTGRIRFIAVIVAAVVFAVSLSGCGGKTAAKYPEKPITVICPWSAGGSTDMVARVVSTRLAGKLGVAVNVVDKPGGNGVPGTVEVLQAAADGYTICAESDGTSSIIAAWGKDVPFDIKERTYLARAAEFPWVFFVKADSPWKTLDDVAQAIKTDGANVKWGWLGATAGADVPVAQFMAEAIKRGIDVSKVKMVTYPGGSQTAVGVAGGHVDIGVASTTSVGSVYSAGKVRLIAITGKERFKGFPDVPTTVEQGWTSVTFRGVVGFSGPKGLPDNVVKVWEESVKQVVNDPSTRAEWDKIGAEPAFMGSKEYRDYVIKLSEEIRALPVGGGK